MQDKTKEATTQAKPESKTAKIVRWVIGTIAVLAIVGIFIAMLMK
jgi:hypothetical protein